MHNSIVITGTDTGIGKTIFAAGLTHALKATYWKPIQAGLSEETDTQIVARLSHQPVLPEAYRLNHPASPHISAEVDGVIVQANRLKIPNITGKLVIEGAGGILVPINKNMLLLEIFVKWKAPIILCARTSLGTINHTLLSLQALKSAGCSVIGVAFIGQAEPKVEKSICDFGKVTHLGRLPIMQPLTPKILHETFAKEFDLKGII